MIENDWDKLKSYMNMENLSSAMNIIRTRTSDGMGSRQYEGFYKASKYL